MIKIDFQEPTSVEWKEWHRKCAVARDEMVERFENGQKPKVTDLYKDRRMQSVYKSGKRLSTASACTASPMLQRIIRETSNIGGPRIV